MSWGIIKLIQNLILVSDGPWVAVTFPNSIGSENLWLSCFLAEQSQNPGATSQDFLPHQWSNQGRTPQLYINPWAHFTVPGVLHSHCLLQEQRCKTISSSYISLFEIWQNGTATQKCELIENRIVLDRESVPSALLVEKRRMSTIPPLNNLREGLKWKEHLVNSGVFFKSRGVKRKGLLKVGC